MTQPGTTYIGRYAVRGVIGSGGFGTVYLGVDPDGGGRVAVKVLDGGGDLAGLRARLRAEAGALRRVEDPHCIRVRAVIDEQDLAAIVTDFVDGASLREVLRRHGRLSGPQALDVLSGALRGLQAVHAAGLLHGDMKPDNILIDTGGSSRLIDFGLAGPARAESPGVESVAGSPGYLSPEQIRGAAPDARSDLYACAVMLFELLCGRRPYLADTVEGVLYQHAAAPVPDPRWVEPAMGDALAWLCVRGLAKDPAQRPQSAAQFRGELEAAARERYGVGWAGAGAGLGGIVGAILSAGGTAAAGLTTGTAAAAGTAATGTAATAASGTAATAASGTAATAASGTAATAASGSAATAASGSAATAASGGAATGGSSSTLSGLAHSAGSGPAAPAGGSIAHGGQWPTPLTHPVTRTAGSVRRVRGLASTGAKAGAAAVTAALVATVITVITVATHHHNHPLAGRSAAPVPPGGNQPGSSAPVGNQPGGTGTGMIAVVVNTDSGVAVKLVRPDASVAKTVPLRAAEGDVPSVQLSPDGKQLLVATQSRLVVDDLNGTTVRTLYAPSESSGTAPRVGQASWSPDGKSIAMCSELRTVDGGAIIELDASTGHTIKEIDPPTRKSYGQLFVTDPTASCDYDASAPAWSSDGHSVAYLAENGEDVVIRSLTDGSRPQTVLKHLYEHTNVPGFSELTWGPSGTFLFSEDIRYFGIDNGVWTARRDGSGLRRLLTEAGIPSFSPDGKEFAAAKDETVIIADLDGRILHTVERDKLPLNGGISGVQWGGGR